MNDDADRTAAHDTSNTSTTDLLSGLVGDARDLAIAHLDGLRIEAKEELSRLANATKMAAIALALFSIAALLVGLGLAYLLSAVTALPLWASHLIAAGGFVAIGGVLIAVAKARRRDADAIPESQLAQAGDDARWLAERARDAVV